MHQALRWLDIAAAGALLVLGCVHNFIAAPAIYDEISTDLFWFLSAGLALWFGGAINLVRQAAPSRAALFAAVPVNLLLLGFVVAFGLHTGEIATVGGLLLLLPTAIEAIFSVAQLGSTRTGP